MNVSTRPTCSFFPLQQLFTFCIPVNTISPMIPISPITVTLFVDYCHTKYKKCSQLT